MKYTKINYKDPTYPKKLLQIPNYPKELYITGKCDLLNKPSLAIIGSRNCTEYGRKQATHFAEELSKQNICIVSGLAIGIDASAHIGAVDNIRQNHSSTAAGGFNKIYPKQNEWLFHKILQNGGCIITEYAPNVEADKKNFPKRNRIVSGISDAVLVVEAEYRSGTSITADYAKSQGKTVCCLPSNLDSRCSLGTSRLIQQGAKLITKPSEIIEILENKNENQQKKLNIENINQTTNNSQDNEKTISKKTSTKEVPQEYKEIYDQIAIKPAHINDICKASKKTIQEITPILTMLELEELIEQLPGNKFKIKED